MHNLYPVNGPLKGRRKSKTATLRRGRQALVDLNRKLAGRPERAVVQPVLRDVTHSLLRLEKRRGLLPRRKD